MSPDLQLSLISGRQEAQRGLRREHRLFPGNPCLCCALLLHIKNMESSHESSPMNMESIMSQDRYTGRPWI